MRQYKKPVLEEVKLLIKEDIALTRTNIGGVNETYNGKSITTYNSTENALAINSIESTPVE